MNFKHQLTFGEVMQKSLFLTCHVDFKTFFVYSLG